MTFGKWLREKRIAQRLTQEEVAKRAGMSRVMLATLEGDRCGTRPDKIPGLALALDLDLGETYQRAGFAAPPGAGETDVRFAREMEPILRRAGEHRPRLERTLKRVAEEFVTS